MLKHHRFWPVLSQSFLRLSRAENARSRVATTVDFPQPYSLKQPVTKGLRTFQGGAILRAFERSP
jgi:hypothetical protein